MSAVGFFAERRRPPPGVVSPARLCPCFLAVSTTIAARLCVGHVAVQPGSSVGAGEKQWLCRGGLCTPPGAIVPRFRLCLLSGVTIPHSLLCGRCFSLGGVWGSREGADELHVTCRASGHRSSWPRCPALLSSMVFRGVGARWKACAGALWAWRCEESGFVWLLPGERREKCLLRGPFGDGEP